MDLEKELLDVLDDPGLVWSAVANNLATGPRTLLLVFTSCTTPVTMIEWQQAVARISTAAAVDFEASLRALDDSFVAISRIREGEYRARFRNPSMEEFCAQYLDKNIGVAVNIASAMPSLHQIDRLITLGTARYGHGAWRYPNVHEALIAKPSLLLERLLALLPSSPAGQLKHSYVARLLALLFGQAERVEPSEVNRVRSSLAAFFRRLTFVRHASSLYTLLDDRVAARGVERILGNDFNAFYEQLWSSASELGHFDSLVNLDNALNLDGRVAPWADRFVELTDDWLRSEMDVDDLTSSRDYYWTVSEHLDLKDLGRATEWDELVEGAERESAEVGQPEDYSWRVSEEDEDDAPIGRLEAAMDPVDALFEGLAAAERPEQQSVP